MAKSKKALKALKRRKEAKGRSRVLKERQDYTAGGRVKSQFGGFIPNLDMAEIEKRARAAANRAAVNREQAARADAGGSTDQEANQTSATGTNISGSQPISNQIPVTNQAAATNTDLAGDDIVGDAPAELETPDQRTQPPPVQDSQPTVPPATTAAQQTTAPPVTGRIPQDQVNLDSSPFDYSNLNVNPNAQVLNVRVNDGSGNRIVQVPFGSLSAAQQQDLRNIASNNPDLNKRAVIAYDYLNRSFGLKAEAEETEEEAPAEETPPTEEAPPAEETPTDTTSIPLIYTKSYEEFAGPPPQEPSGGGVGVRNTYNARRQAYNTQRTRWDSLSPTQRFQQFGAGQGSLGQVFTQTGTTGGTGKVGAAPGDPAKEVLDKIYDEEQRKDFRVDGPEAFQTQQTSLEGTVLGGRQLSDVTDITQRNVTAGDISTASGTFRGATAQDQISAQTMEAYNQAEANYFEKYPEARQAIQDGTYKNVFDYHAKVGIEQGNTLSFDTARIAKADFDRLAESTSSELQQTQAAQRDAAAEQEALARRPVFTEDLRSPIDP